jgi:hypothetical protein
MPPTPRSVVAVPQQWVRPRGGPSGLRIAAVVDQQPLDLSIQHAATRAPRFNEPRTARDGATVSYACRDIGPAKYAPCPDGPAQRTRAASSAATCSATPGGAAASSSASRTSRGPALIRIGSKVASARRQAATRAASRSRSCGGRRRPSGGLAELGEGEADGDRGGGAGGRARLPVADAGHAGGQRRGQGEQQQPAHGTGTARKSRAGGVRGTPKGCPGGSGRHGGRSSLPGARRHGPSTDRPAGAGT